MNLQYTLNDSVQQRHPLETVKIGLIIYHVRETCKIGCKLLLFKRRKLYMCFPLVPKLLTLSELEWRYFALFYRIQLGVNYVIFVEARPLLSATKFRQKNLLSAIYDLWCGYQRLLLEAALDTRQRKI